MLGQNALNRAKDGFYVLVTDSPAPVTIMLN